MSKKKESLVKEPVRIRTKELANGTWYLAENAAAAQLDEKAIIVKGYQCDFGSDEIQSILGSLQWLQ